MGKVTLVFEYEDGKEPAVQFGMDFMGGRVISAAFFDYRDRFLTDEETEVIAEHLELEPLENRLKLLAKIESLTE